ncbi:MAG: hypothetical protein K2H22_00145, partial [Muribaculaceae bacterium]|nr:hypothetical protein [Muribaculaceae bacterium]
MPLSIAIRPTLIAYFGTSATGQPYTLGGKVDDLTLGYTGNRVTGVSDLAPAVTQNGSMSLFPGGYATINGTAVTFHYYTQDYLGNN